MEHQNNLEKRLGRDRRLNIRRVRDIRPLYAKDRRQKIRRQEIDRRLHFTL